MVPAASKEYAAGPVLVIRQGQEGAGETLAVSGSEGRADFLGK